jgi:chromosome segregation ATPase
MGHSYSDSEAAVERLERRWFAAFKAASGVRAECEALLEAMEITENAWNQARARLAELEALRDALAEELEHSSDRAQLPVRRDREAMTAA